MDQCGGKIVASGRILGTELQGFAEKPLGLDVIRAIQIDLPEKKRDADRRSSGRNSPSREDFI